MTLERFARLQALIPARFVTTERVVERARIIKDEGEIDVMRQAARMLSSAAVEALAAVRPGRAEAEVAFEAGTGSAARRFLEAGVRNHRGVRPEQRLAARPAGRPRALAGRQRGAGLRGRLRRILRGFDAHGSAGSGD